MTLRNIGYVSLYTPLHNLKKSKITVTNGWVPLNVGHKSWGSLAYCVPRHVLADVLQSVDVQAEDGTDQRVSEALLALGRNCWFHIPSLSRHIGYTSTIGNATMAESAAVGFEVTF